ncbi:hypothetical protein OG306_33400 [Streptomyces sp. NBC_01241]|uniref:hypothetical protein n=1 Tax=Streptomyces sp. NBC_01241 TaxID=2903794 RepID=UPI00352BDC45|nr:hypothetical protein OG306_33400 [Streptomyces sp. NBC_01241]
MDENYKDQFEALTEGLKYEKLYDALADRAELARVAAMHSAEIYKTARKAGLSRKLAGAMAKDYWDYEVKPSTIYVYEEDE